MLTTWLINGASEYGSHHRLVKIGDGIRFVSYVFILISLKLVYLEIKEKRLFTAMEYVYMFNPFLIVAAGEEVVKILMSYILYLKTI